MDNSNRAPYIFAIKAFGDFGITIAIPAVAVAFLGQWLDEKYGTEPRYQIILFALAFVLTAIIVVRKARQYGKKYNAMFDKKV